MRSNLNTTKFFKTNDSEGAIPTERSLRSSRFNTRGCLKVILNENKIETWKNSQAPKNYQQVLPSNGSLLQSYNFQNQSAIRENPNPQDANQSQYIEKGDEILSEMRKRELLFFICVTVYKETLVDMNNTLEGIRQNLIYFKNAGKKINK